MTFPEKLRNAIDLICQVTSAFPKHRTRPAHWAPAARTSLHHLFRFSHKIGLNNQPQRSSTSAQEFIQRGEKGEGRRRGEKKKHISDEETLKIKIRMKKIKINQTLPKPTPSFAVDFNHNHLFHSQMSLQTYLQKALSLPTLPEQALAFPRRNQHGSAATTCHISDQAAPTRRSCSTRSPSPAKVKSWWAGIFLTGNFGEK